MRLLLLAAAVLCLQVPAPAAKRPDVQVLQARVRRAGEGRISVDGNVKITRDRPVKGLVIIFDFLSSEEETLTSQRIQMADEALNPGYESPFHAETMSPPGAVRYRLRAFDGADRELRVGNPGPFTIE